MPFWTLGRVKQEVRNNLDDPQGTYLDDAFLDPKIQTVYERFTSELTGTNSEFDIDLVDVPAVPAGTPNLASYQLPGQPLAQLVNPQRIKWKLAGLDPQFYQLLEGPKDVLPDLIPQNFPVCWEWRKYVIWFNPTTVDIDLNIRGEFDPLALTSDESVLELHPRIGYAVACQVSSDIAKTRGNPSWVKQFGDDAIMAIDEISVQLVKGDQGKVRRVGRQTQRTGSSSIGPNPNP